MALVTESRTRDYRPMLFIAVAVAVAVNGIVIGWAFWLSERRPEVELSPPVIESHSTALCPGNTLDYSFVLTVSRPAHVEVKTSEQKLIAGERISYARLQEFEFLEPTTMEFSRHWIVPPNYFDPVTGSAVMWEPGDYEQVTDANITGQSDVEKIRVRFSIRDDCF